MAVTPKFLCAGLQLGLEFLGTSDNSRRFTLMGPALSQKRPVLGKVEPLVECVKRGGRTVVLSGGEMKRLDEMGKMFRPGISRQPCITPADGGKSKRKEVRA